MNCLLDKYFAYFAPPWRPSRLKIKVPFFLFSTGSYFHLLQLIYLVKTPIILSKTYLQVNSISPDIGSRSECPEIFQIGIPS